MKKYLLFTAALVCAASVNAQVFQMNGEDFGFSFEAAPVGAGAHWGEAGSVAISNPFATTHKLVDCKTNGYNQVLFNGTDVLVTKNGVQGGDNPRDIYGDNPGISLLAPAGGAVVEFTAAADGYVYIVAKLFSNKNYYVFEEGTAIGFTLAMQVVSDAFPEGVIRYEAKGNGEYNVIMDNKWTDWPEKVALGDGWEAAAGDAGKIGINGLGVIGFPVFADCKYLVGAGGSRISWCGAYFCEAPVSVVLQGTDSENPVEDFDLFESNQNLNNTINYTTSDGSRVWPNTTGAFEVNFISTSYENGQGTITFDGEVTSIGDYAFWKRRSLTSITIPSSVASIGHEAFRGCSSLTSIIVDKNNRIYDSRNNCNAIIETSTNTLIAGCQSTVIPSSVTSISEYAFGYCSSLTSITIPSSVASIGQGAFIDCSSLTSITIPSSVTSISGYAFGYCSSLTSITIPSSVASIGEGAFTGCSSLTSITIPSSVASIGEGAFYGCSSLTSITIPSSVTSIGVVAFYECSSLTSITIPSSVTSIGKLAFYRCSSLTSITIPSSVTSIGESAFYECRSLNEVTCASATPPSISNDAFDVSPKNYLYVPKGSKSAYQNAAYWNEFTNIVEIEDTDSPTDITTLDNALYLEPVKVLKGKTKAVTLSMKNAAGIASFQADLVLPEGITLAEDKFGDLDIKVSGTRTTSSNHSISTNVLSDGSTRILYSSMSNTVIASGDGEVATLTLNVAADVAPGEYPITFKNIMMSDDKERGYEVSSVTSMITVFDYTPGDVNNDGKINVQDLVAVVNYIMERPTPGNIDEAADLDENGLYNAVDYVSVVNLILTNDGSAKVKEFALPGDNGVIEMTEGENNTGWYASNWIGSENLAEDGYKNFVIEIASAEAPFQVLAQNWPEGNLCVQRFEATDTPITIVYPIVAEVAENEGLMLTGLGQFTFQNLNIEGDSWADPSTGGMVSWYAANKVVVTRAYLTSQENIGNIKGAATRGEQTLDGTLEMQPFSLKAGESITTDLLLTGATTAYTCAQVDLLPVSGLQLVKAESLQRNHTVTYETLTNGNTRLLLASMNNKPLDEESGLVRLTFKADAEMQPGEYSLTMDGGLLVTAEAASASLTSIGCPFSIAEPSGIQMVGIEATGTLIYNLSGQQMNADNLPQGIYLRDGKKMIVK